MGRDIPKDQTAAKDQVPAEESQSAHSMEPVEGPREPGNDTNERRPPHPVEPAEGARRPEADQTAGTSP